MYNWNFGIVWDYRAVYINGAETALSLSAIGAVFAILIGLIVALTRQSAPKPFAILASIYVEFLRNTPLLVQIFWIFYCLPVLTGASFTAFWAAAISLAVHFSAYFAEIIRSGIASIDKGQTDAARILGFTYAQTMLRIILPQAFRRVLPPLVNMIADLVKLSSLASVIGVYELMHSVNNTIMNTFRPLELYTALAIVYFIIIYPVAFIARRVELKLAKR
ncbi:amino acid ABC transporter permease [Hwanghaeella grinnelliae]|uniref:Amino acid ABC transporter permease n=1 Tax=Hwanghaeella grinnelliae TaxID=2500179 RepID=A0A437QVD4_9PROT|nr:amino acid ABC transporter permease [Hwanghaeella grinnelliae]RVU38438.1 amino acid ABC transporter permease [Hwanghaeella grinnelliae]